MGLALQALHVLLRLWLFYAVIFWLALGIWVWAGALAAATLLLSHAVFPWLLDRLAGVQWISLEEAGDVGPYLREVLAQHRAPLPRLGVLANESPCAMAYGTRRSRARLVVTSGLLTSLPTDEQAVILCHEASHLQSGDFLVATLFAAPILLLATLAAQATQQRRSSEAASVMVPLLGLLESWYAWMYRPFARAREKAAQVFVSRCTQPLPGGSNPDRTLREAILHLLATLGRSSGTLALALRGFSPVSALAAGRWATSSAAVSGTFDANAMREEIAHSAANPFAAAAERRGLHASLTAASAGFHPQFLWDGLPITGLLVGAAVGMVYPGFLAWPALLGGIGRLLQLLHDYIAVGRAPDALTEALTNPPHLWGTSYRARLRGLVAGHGIPDQTWCASLVLQTENGYLPMRFRHSTGILQQSEPWLPQDVMGQEVEARGFLRMREVPFLEVLSLRSTTALFSSYFLPLHALLALLLAGLGAVQLSLTWIEPL